MRAPELLFIGVLSLLPLSPSMAFAEDGRHTRRSDAPPSDATLYEISETVQFDPDDGLAVLLRDATATLLGSAKVGTPLCPDAVLVTNPDAETCTVIGQGQDAVSLATGLGPVWGTFGVVVDAPGNSSVHIPDLPVMTGTFQGTVDLSLAVQPLMPMPLGYLRDGTLTFDQTGQTVAFSGTFRLPFAVDDAGRAAHARGDFLPAYYLADDGTLLWIRPHERALGFPLVRLEIQFAQ
jgi:hypothetical protein